MNLKLVSYNGNNINDTTNYSGFISDDIKLQGGARIIDVARSGRRPVYAAKILSGYEMKITIQMRGTISSQLDTLKSWFDVEDETPRKLLCKDIANADKQWYVMATTSDMPTFISKDSIRIILSVADPVWRSETENTDAWTITASGQTNVVAVGGNAPARPRLVITPTDAGSDRYAYRRLAIWHNPNAVAMTNYPLNVIGTVWNTGAIITAKMQASGNDLRVFVNGVETNRWLQDINTANTKVWITINFQPGITLTLDTAISAGGAVGTITIKKSAANDAAIKKLPPSGQALIESELYTYTGVDVKNRRLTGCTRAVKGTAAAAHVTLTPIYWIEHEIWIYYGSSTAPAPETDDTRKPIIALTSTNVSWVYADFWATSGLRAGSWKPSLVKTANTKDPDRKSGYYTGNRLADADPATEAGAVMKAWKSGAVWKAENATIEWNLYNPATFTEITATGEKYRSGVSWPAAVNFSRSINGTKWVIVWTEATPATAATWTALTAHSAVSLSTGCPYVKMSFSGTIGATADTYAAHELEDVTLTLASANVPQGTFNAEQSCYFIDAVITNTTSGEWFRVVTSMPLNTTVTIDCENKKAYTADNAPVNKLEWSSNRKDWLNLAPGNNTLKFEDVGSVGLTAPVFWRDRNS